MPIGGAEDRIGSRVILRKFLQLAGGPQAHIVVIPAASAIPTELGERYRQIFTDLGAGSASVVNPPDRESAEHQSAELERATGIFMTGGDQAKLLTLIGGTRTAAMIRDRYHAGAVVAGTSAGASAMSQHMIAFGWSGPDCASSAVHMMTGLGLTTSLIIDQHFSQRHRLGRLSAAVTAHPSKLGVGVDENTALIIDAYGCCEVIGAATVTFVDGSRQALQGLPEPCGDTALLIHTLCSGGQFDLTTRRAVVLESDAATEFDQAAR